MHSSHPGQGWDTRAFEASERARARSLLDLLSQAHIHPDKGVDPALADQNRGVQRSLSAKALELQRVPVNGVEYRQLEAEIANLTAETASPAQAPSIDSQPLTLHEIQTKVLDRGTMLLEYSLGDERSYLFAVTPASLQVYTLPGRTEIESAARDLNSDLQDYSADRTQLNRDAAALSAMLLTPVAAQLKGNRLMIVGDGELSAVPFGALPARATHVPLIVTNEIVTQPSASMPAILRNNGGHHHKAGKQIAVIADPVFESSDPRLKNIPAAASIPARENEAPSNDAILNAAVRNVRRGGAEAHAILALAPAGQSLSLLGFQANRADVTDGRLANYRIVHFATHGLIDRTHPQLSGLALSLFDPNGRPLDGFLDLNSIFDMKLNADLVVLSACETGQGKLVGGEGMLGLTRGFLYAGASSLVVSLWSVDDEATSELMRRFYDAMLGHQHLRPAAALRAAQRSMILNSRWQDPYYWAAFTIQGEWR
jgi:CHAT domain-containing protein